jgi:outer membrane protein OmpA-like peptidoglycan-associated protein
VNVAEQAANWVGVGRPSRLRRATPVVAVSSTILALAVVGATWAGHGIEGDLRARAGTALAAYGLPATVKVHYHGLDAILTGTVQHPQQAADAIGAVVSVSGTRHVRSEVTLAGGSYLGQLAPLPDPSPSPTGTATTTPGGSAGQPLPAGKITFATNNAALSAAAKAYLAQVATVLLADPGLQLAVRGHSDNSGPDEKNWALSKRRADAVVAYLVSKAVPAARLHPAAFAATLPVASNGTPDGRAANRRVELAIEESP